MTSWAKRDIYTGMMNKIVLDIETKNSFSEAESREATALDISLLVIYEYATDTYHSYTEKEFKKLWPLLERTDLIIGYNSDYFDIPLLNKYYPGDLQQIPSLDLLAEIYKTLGRRVSLDMVASGTLGAKKIGKGLEAIRWWRDGEIDKVRRYCQEDVRLTKELYEYALANNKLRFKLVNDIVDVPLDTKDWEKRGRSALNYTLPI